MKKIINSFKSSDLLSKINMKLVVTVVLIIIPLFLGYMYFTMMSTLPEIKETLKENQQLQTKIDSIQADNKFMVERMFELEKNQTVFFELVNKNNELIKQNNKELDKLKKAYNDKINHANTYDVSQLDSFFTNRYRDYYNR